MSDDAVNRYKGALTGLAVGDALGTTIEFQPPGTFAPLTDIVGGGPFRLKPGQWTDDTSMALCLAESLIECNGFDPEDQMERYVRWYRDGHLSCTGRCFDIGNTTRDALVRFEKTRHPYSGSTDERAAGNGAVMRLAPVPLFFAKDPHTAVEKSGESSRTTHGAAASVDACRYFGGLISGAVCGVSKETLLSERYHPAGRKWRSSDLSPLIYEIACGSFKTREPPEIKGSGYVVKSLEAALWAFYKTTSFRDGCLAAVNLGNDADTTGAVYGQLAGAYYGYRNMPDNWLNIISDRHLIVTYAEKLHRLSSE